MRLGGLDIATTSGFAFADGEAIQASSFRPGAKRPFDLARGEVDFGHEGAVAREFRDYLRAWLVANEIEALGIERPLRSNVTFRKPIVDMKANFAGQALKFEEKGGTTFNIIYRLYVLHGHAVETCCRLNIPVHVVNNTEWRRAFLGDVRPPRGSTNQSAWWKNQSMLQCHRIGVEVKNADASDAVGVLWWLRGKLNPRIAGPANDLFRKAT